MKTDCSLRATGIVAGYSGRAVLRDLSCSFLPAHVYGVIGPNGSGKTTLLRALGGLMPVRPGRVELHGEDAHAMPARERARIMAYVPQQLVSPMAFTVSELVAMGRTPFLKPWASLTRRDWAIVENAMAQCEVNHLRSRLFDTLSGGEQQRVAVAKALAQEARVILLDEPTAHLDIKHAWHIMELVHAMSRKRQLTLVLSLHDLNLAAAFCDELILLDQGCVAKQGVPAEVLVERDLARVYGHPLRIIRDGTQNGLFIVPERSPAP